MAMLKTLNATKCIYFPVKCSNENGSKTGCGINLPLKAIVLFHQFSTAVI